MSQYYRVFWFMGHEVGSTYTRCAPECQPHHSLYNSGFISLFHFQHWSFIVLVTRFDQWHWTHESCWYRSVKILVTRVVSRKYHDRLLSTVFSTASYHPLGSIYTDGSTTAAWPQISSYAADAKYISLVLHRIAVSNSHHWVALIDAGIIRKKMIASSRFQLTL